MNDERHEYPKFVKWLQGMLASRHVTLRQVAEYSGVSASALSLLARGKARPSMETIHKLAGYFKVDPNRVLPLAGYPVPETPESPPVDAELTLMLYSLGRELTPEEIQSVKDYIAFVLAQKRAKKQNE